MPNSDELEHYITLALVAVLTGLATKYGIDGATLMTICTALATLVVAGISIYRNTNMKKVPENSTAISTTAPMPVGSTVPPSIAAAAKVVGALLIGFLIVHSAPAMAQPKLTGNPIKDIKTAVGAPEAAAATSVANALAKPFQDLAAFIGNDNTQAVALATAIPSLQDGNGQQCWIAMQSFAAIFKAHPIPVTLQVASDIEALRLAEMAANKVCGNSACTQVFADLTNTVQAASPTPLPIPSLNSLCSKVPQIAVTAPVTPAPLVTVPAPAGK